MSASICVQDRVFVKWVYNKQCVQNYGQFYAEYIFSLQEFPVSVFVRRAGRERGRREGGRGGNTEGWGVNVMSVFCISAYLSSHFPFFVPFMFPACSFVVDSKMAAYVRSAFALCWREPICQIKTDDMFDMKAFFNQLTSQTYISLNYTYLFISR